MNQNGDRIRDDEVDLVDILEVIIKRKWVIIGVVLVSLLLAGIYTVPKMTGGQEVTYQASVVIEPPQVYTTYDSVLLEPENARIDRIYRSIDSGLNQKSLSGGASRPRFSYEILVEEGPVESMFLSITIKGPREEAQDAARYLYGLYQSITGEIEEKNQKIFRIVQSNLREEMQRHEYILRRTRPLPVPRTTEDSSPASDTQTQPARVLDYEIINIQLALELNNMTELLGGDFKMKAAGERTVSIDEDNVQNIGTYFIPAHSTTRQLLPLIIGVFLALIVGILLAFVVEFFSREDVRRRLKEAGRK
jgi:hypothetical protein